MQEVKLYQDTSKVNKKGVAPITLICQFKNKTIKLPSGIGVPPAKFSAEKQRISGKSEDDIAIRQRLDDLRRRMGMAMDHYDTIGKVPKTDELRAYIEKIYRKENNIADPDEEKKADSRVVAFFPVFYALSAKRRKESYLKTFSQVKYHLELFDPKLKWEGLTEQKLDDYADYLIDCELSNQTIHNHFKNLKVVSKVARKKDFVVPSAIDDYQYKGELARPISLTKMELNAFIGLKPDFETPQWKAWTRWLFRCYTSLRISECNGLERRNFFKENDQWIVRYTSHKTKKENLLPISKSCELLLEQCHWRIPVMSRQRESDYVKELCKKAGITDEIVRVRHSGTNRTEEVLPKWKLISSHTARRTFGKRFIEEGGSLFDLQIIYQHHSIKTTAEYIDITITDLLNNSKGFMDKI